MDFTYENHAANTYLVYTVKQDEQIDSMSLGMLTNNTIQGLAPVQYAQMDETKYLKYNVSAKITVKQFFMGPVNRKRVLGVFHGIVDAMLSAEDYMLDIGSIPLDLDYIFADVSTCETVLLCIPIIREKKETVDLKTFFRDIVFSTQFDPTENCDYVAKIINYLNMTSVFILSDFKELLLGLEGNTTTPSSSVVKSEYQPTVSNQERKQPVVEKNKETRSMGEAERPSVSSTKPQSQPQQIPPQPQQIPPQPQQVAPQQEAQKAGKEISFFYLMQHYNKDNAAAYKAQKAAKKRPAKGKDSDAVEQPTGRSSASAATASGKDFGFVIPGQPSNMKAQSPLEGKMQQNQNIAPQVPLAAPKQQVEDSREQQVSPENLDINVSSMMQEHPMEFGNTTVLNMAQNGETTILNAEYLTRKINPHIVRAKNNERIGLNKPVFRIGKEKSYVDYFISDNTAISRSHANIISREGEYFVVDTNSTNHTFVNDKMINSNQEIKITHGDKIRFANEEFEFYIY